MFTNNREEYQTRLKRIQELEKKELLSPHRIKAEDLSKAWAKLAYRANKERKAS